MKLTTLFMIVFFVQVSAKSYSQKISINKRDIALETVLQVIKQQTNYHFLYESNVQLTKKINVHVTNATIDETLKACFKGLPLIYRIIDKTILVANTDEVGFNGTPNTSNQTVLPGITKLKGTVTDENGVPLAGVAIRVKNTTRGVATDVNGNFELDVSAGDILIASFIGYEPFEVKIADQTSLKIILKEAKNELNTVVITALGIKRQTKALTYNVQEVNGSEVSTIKGGNFVNNLAGKVAGATINTSSTGLGGSARVVLRGTKSIDNLKNNALYVVDGVPLANYNGAGGTPDIYSGANATGDGISQINPDDIASISVLTGPAAAALYGANAASGVIIITTKKAEANKTSINVSNNTTFSSPFVMPQFQNTYGSDPGSYFSWGQKLATPSTYKPADYFQTGTYINNSISVATGTAKNQTYVSAANANGRGIIPNNELDRLNLTLRNTSSFLNDKMTMDLSAMYIKESDQNMISQGLYNNPLVSIYLFPRGDDIQKYQIYERYDASKGFKTQFWPFGDLGFAMQNPYWITNRDLNTHQTQRYVLNASLKYVANDWFNISARVRSDNSEIVGERKYYASTSGIFAGPNGFYSRSTTDYGQTYADVIANFSKKYKSFGANLFVGASYEDKQTETSGYGGNLNTIPNQFIFANINPDASTALATQNIVHQQAQAVFGTLQLNYKSLVFLDASGRTDWNSALSGTTNQSIFYPSVGISTILTDLLNMNSKTLSYLKIRGSYSEVGSPPNPYIGTKPEYPYSGGSPVTVSDYPNKTLAPERTRSAEAGVNFKFFGNLIGLDVTGYKSSTYNQIFHGVISSSSLFNGIYINGGQIDNKGIEASLNVNAAFGKFKWTSGAVFSLNRNKIIKLLDNYYDANTGQTFNIRSINEGGTTSYAQILKEGGSTGDIYVNTLATDEHGYIIVDPRTRQVKANDTTYVKAGNSDPRYNIGFSNRFTYRNFSLSVLVTARVGGVGVSITQALMDRFGVSATSAQARDAGGVMVNGGLIPAQAYYNVTGGGLTGIGAAYVYSATNFRLGEATLSYQVPPSFFKNKIKGATLSLTGNNLFMFYNKAPFDPESTASTGTYYQGIDYFRQPSLRSIGFNVSVQF